VVLDCSHPLADISNHQIDEAGSRIVRTVCELSRLPKRRVLPVAVPHPLVQVRIPAADVAEVAFELRVMVSNNV